MAPLWGTARGQGHSGIHKGHSKGMGVQRDPCGVQRGVGTSEPMWGMAWGWGHSGSCVGCSKGTGTQWDLCGARRGAGDAVGPLWGTLSCEHTAATGHGEGRAHMLTAGLRGQQDPLGPPLGPGPPLPAPHHPHPMQDPPLPSGMCGTGASRGTRGHPGGTLWLGPPCPLRVPSPGAIGVGVSPGAGWTRAPRGGGG